MSPLFLTTDELAAPDRLQRRTLPSAMAHPQPLAIRAEPVESAPRRPPTLQPSHGLRRRHRHQPCRPGPSMPQQANSPTLRPSPGAEHGTPPHQQPRPAAQPAHEGRTVVPRHQHRPAQVDAAGQEPATCAAGMGAHRRLRARPGGTHLRCGVAAV